MSSPIPSTSWWSASCSVAGCGSVRKHSCKYPQQQRPVNRAGTKFLKQIQFSYFVGLFPVVLNLYGESKKNLCRYIKFNSFGCLPLISLILKQTHFSYFVGHFPASVLNSHVGSKINLCRYVKFNFITYVPWICLILKQLTHIFLGN